MSSYALLARVKFGCNQQHACGNEYINPPPESNYSSVPHPISMPSLSRTSSTASVSSDDAAGSNTVARRTRKRFTNNQLTMLENLFHQNSHPSREDRDAVAKLGGMETKSVTIWFQNKRQTERKVALSNATNNNTGRSPSSSSPLAAVAMTPSNRASRPSLDRVASRSELPMPPPRTPTRKRDPNATIWDNMPSSPIAPPFSPPLREYVEFRRSKRTLEWACAAARLSDRHGMGSRPRRGSKEKERTRERERERQRGKLDWTDEETDEAITPPCTLAGGDVRWTMVPGGGLKAEALHPAADDDDMMKAALTLCGLGRRP
ncbi:hypothetical protein D9615_001079 [Tricholomella constricta]|uniref:Homeobox domain-containing protein n=1 Tax=Tricholomella constricta TaxID=117010 RepID=A0A8H5M935_9AGAR|nr:hypothetical protein D9615_001079 [Tricholomella constricta]